MILAYLLGIPFAFCVALALAMGWHEGTYRISGRRRRESEETFRHGLRCGAAWIQKQMADAAELEKLEAECVARPMDVLPHLRSVEGDKS